MLKLRSSSFAGSDNASFSYVYDIRLSALSNEALKELRFVETRKALEVRAQARLSVDEYAAEADLVLFAAIGASAMESERKRSLLRIKRAIRRGRLPGRDLIESLPGNVAGSLRQLDEALARYQRACHQLETAFTADRMRTRAVLAERARTPLLRNGILHSAPSLEDLMDSEDWPERLISDKRAARVAQFVYRAAAKTSPFSTFTCTGRAGVESYPGNPTAPDVDSTCLVRQLDGKIWALLVRDLAERPEVIAKWDLRPNPSLTWVESFDKFMLLGSPPVEQLRSFPDHPAIRLVYAALPDPTSAENWTKRVAEQLGDLNEAQAADTVQMLLRGGVLEADCPVSENVDHPVGELVEWLEQRGVGPAIPYLATLTRLATLLAPCPSPTDPQVLRAQHRQLHSTVSGLLSDLGHKADALVPDLELIH